MGINMAVGHPAEAQLRQRAQRSDDEEFHLLHLCPSQQKVTQTSEWRRRANNGQLFVRWVPINPLKACQDEAKMWKHRQKHPSELRSPHHRQKHPSKLVGKCSHHRHPVCVISRTEGLLELRIHTQMQHGVTKMLNS